MLLFNEIVQTFKFSGQPQEARSGDPIPFLQGSTTSATATVSMYDQAGLLVQTSNEYISLQAIGGPGDLADLLNSTANSTLQQTAPGVFTMKTSDGSVTFTNVKILTSSYNLPYQRAGVH